jgi:hypothetical protein
MGRFMIVQPDIFAMRDPGGIGLGDDVIVDEIPPLRGHI